MRVRESDIASAKKYVQPVRIYGKELYQKNGKQEYRYVSLRLQNQSKFKK